MPDVIGRADPDGSPRSTWKGRGARIFSLAASAALLALLYRSIDVRLVGSALLKASPLWLVVSVGMILPITALRAARFLLVSPPGSLPGFTEALRVTFVASAFNVFIPAKAGDLIKSHVVSTQSDTSAGVSIAIVLYERVSDLFGLFSWCVAGWLIGRPQVHGLPHSFWIPLAILDVVFAVLMLSERAAGVLWTALTRALPRGRLVRVRELAQGWPDLLRSVSGRRLPIAALSVLLWLTHLFQIWLFTVTLGIALPFTVCASLAAIALMAGQVPLTIAGVGPRDVALVVLLARYMPAESAAALGVLVATRNLLPPLIGMPMMRPYVASVMDQARHWRRTAPEHVR